MRLPFLPLAAAALLASAVSAHAVVRGAVVRNPNGLRQSVVRIESSRGELCSGTLVAPTVVLTAAHCLQQRAAYRVIAVDRAFRQRAVMAIAGTLHPAFVPGTTPRTQPGVDLALLKLRSRSGVILRRSTHGPQRLLVRASQSSLLASALLNETLSALRGCYGRRSSFRLGHCRLPTAFWLQPTRSGWPPEWGQVRAGATQEGRSCKMAGWWAL